MKRLYNPAVSGALWLILRLWLGYTWLAGGFEKIVGAGSAAWVGAKAGTAVTGFLNGALAKADATSAHPEVHSWYADFIASVALPHAALFSYLVAYGELLVGLALILGVFTRFALVMGLLMNFAFLFAGTSSNSPEMVLVGMVLLLGAGQAVYFYGVDHFLQPALDRLLHHGPALNKGDTPRPHHGAI